MWDEIAVQVSKDFPDVTWDKELVDAATARMVNKPATLDTIVATNLHADILSDLAAALAGSLGIAPTGNIDPERRYPSMFEPIHGSAFDIMGKGLANPVGTFWSVVMLLEHLGEHAAAARVMQAIEARHRQPVRCTPATSAARPPPRQVTARSASTSPARAANAAPPERGPRQPGASDEIHNKTETTPCAFPSGRIVGSSCRPRRSRSACRPRWPWRKPGPHARSA